MHSTREYDTCNIHNIHAISDCKILLEKTSNKTSDLPPKISPNIRLFPPKNKTHINKRRYEKNTSSKTLILSRQGNTSDTVSECDIIVNYTIGFIETILRTILLEVTKSLLLCSFQPISCQSANHKQPLLMFPAVL